MVARVLWLAGCVVENARCLCCVPLSLIVALCVGGEGGGKMKVGVGGRSRFGVRKRRALEIKLDQDRTL
jgi:hypothetical protein